MQPSRVISNRFHSHDYALQPVELPCRNHPGSTCLNYCHEEACLRLLCEECIEEHLEHHKKNSLPDVSIRSLKKVREICVEKLNRLIEDLGMRMGSLRQPKNPQQILEEANMKFEAIKKIMFEIIEQELSRFYEQLRSKVNESFSAIKNLEEIHVNLAKIIAQLQESRSVLVEGARELPDTLEKVIMMDDQLYLDTFTREASGYSQKLACVDFEVSINQNAFKTSVNECLRINRFEEEPQSLGVSRSLSTQGKNQSLRSRSRSAPYLESSKQISVDPKLEAENKILHFFETNSSSLHFVDLGRAKVPKKQIVSLGDYVVPAFHASLLSAHGYLFISGGIVEIGEDEMKSPLLSKFSLRGKSSEQFKKDFSKVKPRSSHCMCEVGDHIFIMGGYGPDEGEEDPEIETTLEKVNIKNGHVTLEAPSRYGGMCIASVFHGSILKANEEGVEMFSLATARWSIIGTSDSYCLVRGCGWSKISENTLLIYGGYDEEERGVSACWTWEVSESFLTVKKQSVRLPIAEGFLNNPGAIVGGELYALQNMEAEGEEDILESERVLLKFDGALWEQVTF